MYSHWTFDILLARGLEIKSVDNIRQHELLKSKCKSIKSDSVALVLDKDIVYIPQSSSHH